MICTSSSHRLWFLRLWRLLGCLLPIVSRLIYRARLQEIVFEAEAGDGYLETEPLIDATFDEEVLCNGLTD